MTLLEQVSHALDFPADALPHVAVHGDGELTSVFPVTDFAVDAMAAAGVAVGQLIHTLQARGFELKVDRRLASWWFSRSIDPIGWHMPPAWDSIAGDYASRDGWIRLHTNAPHHKAAALGVLRCADDRATVARAVATWPAQKLEAEIVAAKGCAAAMRTCDDWALHPQGKALAGEPLVALSPIPVAGQPPAWQFDAKRPLEGLKVLDLTRVLAGPVATRFLAGCGADVLRIDPPEWDEPSIVPDVTLGKRCARLDLRASMDRQRFEQLLAQADVIVHSYRPGALDGLGYGPAARRRLNPGLIDVSLDAYGWSGPWSGRRGFDSLVQMSTGIAHGGMVLNQADRPVPLPVQALDHATGYLIAATVVRSVTWRIAERRATTARLSLARTAQALLSLPRIPSVARNVPLGSADFSATPEQTPWGPARRLRSPLSVNGVPLAWQHPASLLGTAEPLWGIDNA